MSCIRIGVLLLTVTLPNGVAFAATADDENMPAVQGKADARVAKDGVTKDPAGKGGAAKDASGNGDAAAVDERPTAEEIQETFDSGDYQATLRHVARVINLKGDAAAEYDKYKLWMLRGESYLRLKQLKQAGEAFAMAAKETDQDVEAATARATRMMIGQAKAYQVKRQALGRREKPQSADILDPEQREQALRILYEDAKVKTEPIIKAAVKARELPPIARALQALAEARDLELAATGGEAELSNARDEVAQRARELIERELADMRENVQTIQKEANQTLERRTFVEGRRHRDRDYGPNVVRGSSAKDARNNARRDMRRRTGVYARDESDGDSVVRIVKRGLTDQDKEDLKAVIQQCKKILPTIDELAEASGAEVDEFEDLIKTTKDVGTLAVRTLNDKYRVGD